MFSMVSYGQMDRRWLGELYKTSRYLVSLVCALTGAVLERNRVAASGRAEVKDLIMSSYTSIFCNTIIYNDPIRKIDPDDAEKATCSSYKEDLLRQN